MTAVTVESSIHLTTSVEIPVAPLEDCHRAEVMTTMKSSLNSTIVRARSGR